MVFLKGVRLGIYARHMASPPTTTTSQADDGSNKGNVDGTFNNIANRPHSIEAQSRRTGGNRQAQAAWRATARTEGEEGELEGATGEDFP
mmetsp:Transcript_46982/g.91704  ORF Transcript_46982/g.91704 Transcript_46982/m.91704 type:complete len:90 (+) Transcript_46982:273-542(+)